jgi:Type IV secretion-system coupling protein DNA-binding domain
MSRLEEQLTEQFYQWERRGRGWQVFGEPVSLEPPFRPFYGHYPPEAPCIDDGRRPTLLSSFVQKLSRRLATEAPAAPPVIELCEEPEPETLVRDPGVELQTTLPANLNIPKEAFESLLANLSLCREPITFELVGRKENISAQFAACPDDAPAVQRQLQAYFPEAVFLAREGTLEKVWDSSAGEQILAVEFGLEREFMFPLGGSKLDPFIGIVAALTELEPGEFGLFQVLFQSVQHHWAESIIRSVTHDDGKPFFVNMPELADAAKRKAARPLYATVVRILVRTDRYERTLGIARNLAASLRVFINPEGNALIPLTNDDYPLDQHIEDALCRQSRRSGMILSCDELIGFVHLPSSAVRSPALVRQTAKTKAAPKQVTEKRGVCLGENSHQGESSPVYLGAEERVRHVHIIGASGTGKSTLLFNLIRQDIENGEGLGVLDPHGDLIDRILGIIPPERVEDVVLIDPTDLEFPVGFNILSAHSELEKNLLASDLVSVFQRLSTSWGEQMGSVLRNAILAFLESSRGGTLSDLRRFLLEPAFRKSFLETVNDPDIVYYWEKGFNQLSGNKSIGPVLTRLDTFLSPKPIRYMVAQPKNRLDFGEIMDRGKIFLAKLSQGQMGRENSFLLGSLFVAKIQQLAMGRQF